MFYAFPNIVSLRTVCSERHEWLDSWKQWAETAVANNGAKGSVAGWWGSFYHKLFTSTLRETFSPFWCEHYTCLLAELNEALKEETQHLKVLTGQVAPNGASSGMNYGSFGSNQQLYSNNQSMQTMLAAQQLQQLQIHSQKQQQHQQFQFQQQQQFLHHRLRQQEQQNESADMRQQNERWGIVIWILFSERYMDLGVLHFRV